MSSPSIIETIAAFSKAAAVDGEHEWKINTFRYLEANGLHELQIDYALGLPRNKHLCFAKMVAEFVSAFTASPKEGKEQKKKRYLFASENLPSEMYKMFGEMNRNDLDGIVWLHDQNEFPFHEYIPTLFHCIYPYAKFTRDGKPYQLVEAKDVVEATILYWIMVKERVIGQHVLDLTDV